MAGMSEPSEDKTTVNVRIPVELCNKVISKFAEAGDKQNADAFVRAIQSIVAPESQTKKG